MQTSHLRFVAILFLLSCGEADAPPPLDAEDFTGLVHPTLAAHTAEFEKRVYRVTEGVHVAVGYALANSILIEGDDGVIIVDVTGSVQTARAVRAEFEKITDKPIRALIYTHNHADHVFGGMGFFDGSVPANVDIYAHETTEYYIDRVVGILRPVLSRRSARMFGTYLADGPEGLINDGIGRSLEIGPDSTLGLLRPTRTFRDKLELEIAGVKLVLIHAPGETNDQLFVWLPEKKTLLPGDNVYKAFPNLYTIRGTLYRDVLEWSRSLDKMRDLRPDHLVPSHTRPVSGTAKIEAILVAYRDAIQYVHDQTVRGMNRGLTPDELVQEVVLPPHLRDHPYLQELYGTVAWSVRSIFGGYLGWFDGDAAHLARPSPEERAAGTIELAGGTEAVLAAARAAVDEKRFAWAAELANHVIHSGGDADAAKRLKARALRELAHRSISPNGRNYYLTQALELEGVIDVRARSIDETVLDTLRSIPIANFMEAMTVNLDPKKSADTDTRLVFEFSDIDERYELHIRRGVAALRHGDAPNPDIRVTVNSIVWKEIVVGFRNPAIAFASGDVEIEGGAIELAKILSMFR